MGKEANKFSGIHVAMNSCYGPDGKVSPEAARKLTRFLIDKGVQGLYVGGSTGEGPLQTAEERMEVLEAVAAESKGEVTVIAHIGAITTEDSVKLARHAEKVGIDGISSIAPFYFSYTEAAVKQYWLSMMDSTSLPFFIYYIPAATGFQMSSGLLKELTSHERLAGIKITTFSTYELQQFKAIGGDRFVVFNGPDQQYLAGRAMGASGGIGGTYGVMPELFLKIEHYFSKGDMQRAQYWQFVVNDIITDIRSIGLFAAVKEIIKLRGVDCGSPRLPLPPATADNYPAIRRVHDKIMRYVAEAAVVTA
ncbi:dihydrodipicolinate synthase family protein [Paenibacillus cymbidii]|uniref:dihydrodipicolinate synthase family protein n=1 Tax=Paenibacillus cymbidii TaxID=1639034 RepID=UPI001082144F|nr:dihydrodipicolinate synthase family protein [Paenibacillus cymbidii]